LKTHTGIFCHRDIVYGTVGHSKNVEAQRALSVHLHACFIYENIPWILMNMVMCVLYSICRSHCIAGLKEYI